ncbi:MAG: tRNA dihydrouridine synthase DusB [Desulfobacterales bacterium]|nr:tRNA dihydrouridine synthase DusB [Desulfobacterales bacterium]
MQIRDLKIKGKTFLAPLAGITNLPFRSLVKEYGCSVVCSEMVSAKGIFYNSEKTMTLMESTESEKPLSIQLFGSDPVSLAKGARAVEDLNVADLIDINFGCSVKKVVKQGAGVALMKDPALTRRILTAVRQATHLPFTIKIRSGWDTSGDQAFKIAEVAQDCGVDAIALHPRTAGQAFRGHSNWDHIRQLKSRASIPVIGNGDILCPEDAVTMMDQTGCDAVMVGRAAMANPFILKQIDQYLETGAYQSPSNDDIFTAMERLVRLYVDYFGEQPACRMLRGRLSWFVKGLPNASVFRKNLTQIHTQNQALKLIRDFRATGFRGKARFHE